MIENTELLFAVIGVFTVLVVAFDLLVDVDCFCGKLISKFKDSLS